MPLSDEVLASWASCAAGPSRHSPGTVTCQDQDSSSSNAFHDMASPSSEVACPWRGMIMT
ncbi:hypothetical protein HMPREF9607_00731 [Cutibacterium modestum HL044PA1]|uniref:Uncharacterized protein n=1 Tax=Cutibacterium modestum HL044PA1 TaxID=765109 RepID=A0ABN0C6Z7_9ACTN|nr:hypothetical protein HMPREF9607_00731 [Cutibacterium modestum HL044PA1]